MSVPDRISRHPARGYTGGAAQLTDRPGTLREVIAGLDAARPGASGRILDETGQRRRFPDV